MFEEIKGLQRGHVCITVASTANYFVPRLWATFRMRHPGVSVSLDRITSYNVCYTKLLRQTAAC